MSPRPELGIDFGTSSTVAVLRRSDGQARPLLFDGTPLLPSAVYLESDGRLLTGRDAVHAARLDPARFEPSPKRRIADGSVLLGDREIPAVELPAAVLRRVAAEAHRVAGSVPDRVTLTHPAAWAHSRRTLLLDAAHRAGLPEPRLVAEPVAAASYFTDVLGHRMSTGSAVVIYDFGAGTFDASVVIQGADGFDTAVVDGAEIGGLDIDAAVVDWLGARYGRHDPVGWQRLTGPRDRADRRDREQLWADVRACKEQLSRAPSARLAVPVLDVEAHLTRAELEQLAGPLVDRTVRITAELIRHAGLAPAQLAGVFLVGGSSRLPLAASMLHRRLAVPSTAIEQPELVVGEGSLRVPRTADDAHLATRILPLVAAPTAHLAPAARSVPAEAASAPLSAAAPVSASSPVRVGSPAPVSPPAPVGPPAPAGRTVGPGRRSARRRMWVGAAAVLVLLLLAGLGWYHFRDRPARNAGTVHDGDGRPAYVPAGWKLSVSGTAKAWHNNDGAYDATCRLDGDTLRVSKIRRGDVSGMFRCAGTAPSYTDVALAGSVKIEQGCAGLWLRTDDHRGFFIDLCGRQVELHLLTNADPSVDTLRRTWTLRMDSTGRNVPVGLVARGSLLSLYVDGRRLGTATIAEIPSGDLDVGAFTGDGSTASMAFSQLRVWHPAS